MLSDFHPDENNNGESINNHMSLFEEYENELPSLTEALKQLFRSVENNDKKVEELANYILDKCYRTIDRNYNQISLAFNNISKNDAYIICSYTCESKNYSYSPHKILNQNLIAKNRREGISKVSKYFYLLLKTLRKLPRYYPPKNNNYLYRSIGEKVKISNDPFNEGFIPYIAGNQKTFWTFLSVTPNQKESYKFLRNDGGNKSGTIFTIGGDIWGYDIELFSFYREKEIILEPERKYKIDIAMPEVNGIINVICSILTTPIVLDNN